MLLRSESLARPQSPPHEILHFRGERRVYLHHYLSLRSQLDFLDAFGELIRVRQFLPEVNGFEAHISDLGVRLSDTVARAPLTERKQRRMQLQFEKTLDTTDLHYPFEVAVQDIVFDESTRRTGEGVISCRLVDSDELYGEQVAYSEALEEARVKIEDKGIKDEFLIRLAVISYTSLPNRQKLTDYLGYIADAAPETVAFDPLMLPSY